MLRRLCKPARGFFLPEPHICSLTQFSSGQVAHLELLLPNALAARNRSHLAGVCMGFACTSSLLGYASTPCFCWGRHPSFGRTSPWEASPEADLGAHVPLAPSLDETSVRARRSFPLTPIASKQRVKPPDTFRLPLKAIIPRDARRRPDPPSLTGGCQGRPRCPARRRRSWRGWWTSSRPGVGA